MLLAKYGQNIIQGGGSSFTLVRQISQGYQACTTFNFHLLILIYSFGLLMIIGPAALHPC